MPPPKIGSRRGTRRQRLPDAGSDGRSSGLQVRYLPGLCPAAGPRPPSADRWCQWHRASPARGLTLAEPEGPCGGRAARGSAARRPVSRARPPARFGTSRPWQDWSRWRCRKAAAIGREGDLAAVPQTGRPRRDRRAALPATSGAIPGARPMGAGLSLLHARHGCRAIRSAGRRACWPSTAGNGAGPFSETGSASCRTGRDRACAPAQRAAPRRRRFRPAPGAAGAGPSPRASPRSRRGAPR